MVGNRDLLCTLLRNMVPAVADRRRGNPSRRFVFRRKDNRPMAYRANLRPGGLYVSVGVVDFMGKLFGRPRRQRICFVSKYESLEGLVGGEPRVV
jgi:hypothetical protein